MFALATSFAADRRSRPGMQEAKIVGLVSLVAWPLIAHGGASPRTSLAWSLACLLYLALARPALRQRLDTALVLLLACTAVQLLPLPTLLVDFMRPDGPGTEGAGRYFKTISLDPALTARALLHVAAVAALLLAARQQLAEGGLRRLTRAIVGLGGIVSAAAIIGEVTSGRLSLWTSVQAGPRSFGPFGDRNHFATWTAMALPLALGYATARRRAHPSLSRQGGSRRRYDNASIEPRTCWLTTAAVMMTLALVLSRSRSGLMAIGAAGMLGLVVVRDRLDPRGRRALMSAIVLASLVSLSWSATPPRPVGTAGTATGLAAEVDLPTARVSSWLTGSGAGTSRLATPDRDGRPAPRSHYLKAAAEGGLLLAIPLLLTAIALMDASRKQLERDITPIWWFRLGSACGLGAVALQSTTHSGLAIPANSALAAILAAILIHARQRTGDREDG